MPIFDSSRLIRSMGAFSFYHRHLLDVVCGVNSLTPSSFCKETWRRPLSMTTSMGIIPLASSIVHMKRYPDHWTLLYTLLARSRLEPSKSQSSERKGYCSTLQKCFDPCSAAPGLQQLAAEHPQPIREGWLMRLAGRVRLRTWKVKSNRPTNPHPQIPNKYPQDHWG
jgi:hypothetical protein